MALKTEFSESELAQILANYNLEKYIDATPFTNGTVQTNIKIKTSKGQYVFRYYENRTVNSVSFETNFLRYLKDHNFPCPAPFKNKYGSYVGIHKQKPYVIFEYMEGQHIKEPNENQKKQLIQKTAVLHHISKNYTPIYIEDRWNYSIELCRDLAQQASKRINTSNSKEKLSWLENELLKLNLPKSLPMGICHADFNFSNILYKDDQFNALLDFDDANYTYLLFDLVVLIESWAWRHDVDKLLNMEEAKEIIIEYSKHRRLSDIEKKHLFDVYKLSILIDCVWYFERGDVKDFYEKRKIDYLDQIGRELFYQELFC
ncbi:homoserine kinase [Lederbergia citrea]|uniref:Homoserine kinase n=1 Tax=Lederbergia citrea TaxID=2833581 RepID=A0A942Z199_9BACI|nr:homoserine kinase [Lederbergia citrea]MBS4204152.1 homoserine kinase [Lederbergia citrea]MBS4221263.1 homoserine kinase [Lederbergia citrea]